MGQDVDDSTRIQLRLIDEVSDRLSRTQIPHWLFGGWAVDFHSGSVTRDHGDLEFFIWEYDGPRAGDLLDAAGYALVDHPHPDEASIWRKDGQLVELYYVALTAGGDVDGRGRWANWPLPENSLGREVKVVADVRCPVVSLECILNTKLTYAQHTGIPPGEKDLADVATLHRVMRTT
ncbi:MAG: hypothetical protein NVSMB52_17370 [Chloroflexota bacterium]